MSTPTLPIATFPNKVWVGYGPQSGDAGLLAQVTPDHIDWARVVAELQATQQYILDNQGGGGPISDRSIEGVKLVLKTVGTTEIADDAITSDQLANDAVDTNSIQAGAVTTTKLDTGVVTTVKLADGSITTIKVVDGQITLAKLASSSVDTSKLVDAAVTTIKILDGNVTTIKIADGAVTTSKLADDAVTTIKIVDGAVTQAKLGNNAVATVNILDANVTAAKLATGAALSNLVDGTVDGAKLVAGSVTSTELANNAVTTAKVLDGAITTNKLADTSVTNGKLALLAVDTGNLIDGAVTAAKLATGAAVANIGAGAIGATLLGTDSVGATQLADNAVDTAAIANGAVTTAKLDNLSVTTGKLVDNSVTLAKLDQLAQNTFLGRTAAGTGNVEALSVSSVKTVLDLAGTNTGDQTITLTGPVTGTGTGSFTTSISAGVVGTTELADTSVTLAKLGSDITTAGKSLLDDASASDQRTTLGLGTAALSTAEPSGLSGLDANLPSNKMVKDFLSANYQDLASKNAANGYAGLDSGGKLPTSILPDLAIVDYLGVVADQTAMLALTGQKGDWCSRSDTGTNFIITGATPSSLGSWTELSYPSGGGGGSVTLSGDVTGSGTGTVTTTIANGTVSLAKMADIATASFIGRTTAGTGVPEALSVSQAKGLLNLSGTNSGDVSLSGESYLSLTGQALTVAAVDLSGTNATGTLAAGRFPALTGDITTAAGSVATSLANNAVTTVKITDLNVTTAKIADNAVTLGKLQTVATSSFLGRTTAGTGTVELLAVSDAKTLLNLTGTNSGDQTITLTGDATGSGTGSFAITIANNAVTTAKIADNNITNAKLAQVATQTFLGRTTAATGNVETLTVAQAKTMLGLTGTNSGDQTITLSGAVSGSGTGAITTSFGNMTGFAVLGAPSNGSVALQAVRCNQYSISMNTVSTKDLVLSGDTLLSSDSSTTEGVVYDYCSGKADTSTVTRTWWEKGLVSVRSFLGTGSIAQLASAFGGWPNIGLLAMSSSGGAEGVYYINGFGDAGGTTAGSSMNVRTTIVNRTPNMGGQAKAVWVLAPNNGGATTGGALNTYESQFLWPGESVDVLRHHGGNSTDNYKLLTKKRFFSDFDLVDHYINLAGPMSDTYNNGGTAAINTAGSSGVMGSYLLGTSSSSTARVYAGCTLGSGAFSFKTANNQDAYWVYACRVKVPTISNGTDTFKVRLGFHDAQAAADVTNGLYWEYDSTIANTWNCRRAAAGVRTTTASATVMSAGTWVDLMIIMFEGTGSYAHFLISTDNRQNWVYAAAMDSGALTTTAGIYTLIGAGITKSLGTTARTLEIDYQAVRWPNNP